MVCVCVCVSVVCVWGVCVVCVIVCVCVCVCIPPRGAPAPVDHGLLIHEVSKSHSTTHHSL